MKERQYAPIWKYIVVLLQIILTVIFMMSVFLLSSLMSKKMLDTNDIRNENFLDSGCYAELFEQKTDELISFLMLRNKFEVNGEYEPEKLINVMEYSKGVTLSDQISNNQEETALDIQEAVAIEGESNESYYSEEEYIEKQNEKKRLTLVSHYKLTELISWSKKGCTKNNGILVEEYLPVSGTSIAESLHDGEITLEQATIIYTALEATLSVIGEEETAYKKGLNEFQAEESNLTYAYSENGELVYSNVAIEEDFLAYARSEGSYLYYNDDDLKFRTNINGVKDYFYNSLDNMLTGIGNGAKLMIAVNTNFEYQDDFLSAKKDYELLHPWVMRSIVIMVISLFGWVITIVYLTTVAGITKRNGQIHLNLFDRLKTELFFGGYVLLNVAFFSILLGISQNNWDIPGLLVMVGVGTFVIDSVFLLFYLSVVRRVKAGTLWENSLIFWVSRSVTRLIHTWKSSIRAITVFGFGTLLLLFLAYESFAQKSVLAIAVLFMLIIAIGIEYLRGGVQQQEIMEGIEKITDGDLAYKLPLDNLHGDNRELAQAVNSIGDGLRFAVEDSTKKERMKADLITNVSHDIKTPLTSIINYVNLLKAEKIENERLKDYINILDEKSQRLRQLTEDLVEASRISSGNITLQMSEINLVELIYQTGGEFNEKFEEKKLTTITKLPKESAIIMADGRRIWRVVENLYNNVAKYALENTRVYVTMEKSEEDVCFSIKNISEQQLNVETVDLTERFIRGDEARTTEGSGLGLSIARNLTTLMGGQFEIELDGDLFTVSITFPLVKEIS